MYIHLQKTIHTQPQPIIIRTGSTIDYLTITMYSMYIVYFLCIRKTYDYLQKISKIPRPALISFVKKKDQPFSTMIHLFSLT